ncbi:MAG: bacteriohemerythrin [Rhodocyclaceae bacterium]|nr:bacteriohemerythrin [Rhodocyclaceae bacterium]MBL0075312.1 bacteriohemerythrin [Rhodocyclaceae bacterium]MBP6108439.1 bacteriohemerythrin [Rhodocyclaceae bacterium]MBP6278260.1 bacteriohemerythrin [Rhodocyclaceae bacterium]
MQRIHKTHVATGIDWVEIPEVGLRVLCGSPADAVKHLAKRGLIVPTEVSDVACETGPNAVLLSDHALQNGEFANLAEFPVLQMLYKQGLLIPGHPNNTGRKPILIGSREQVDSQMRYIYRGNYGLVSREEMMQAGVSAEEATAMMRLKLRFAFGRIHPTDNFLDARYLGDAPIVLADSVGLRRLRPNVFEFSYRGETVTVDINLQSNESYQCAYPLSFHRFNPEYFSIIHSGEGDGWDINRPCMSSIITHQGRIYLIDAGPRLSDTMAAVGITIDQVDGIFHTHAHDDHFAGMTALMRAGRRIRYYATPLVRHSTAKKLAALLGVEEERFGDYFEVHDLVVDQWNSVEGMDVMPMFSPHPVEANVIVFRTMWGDGYKSYAHFADIVSLDVLRAMVTDKTEAPGISAEVFELVRANYMVAADLKKIDIGGGMIHGDAMDFRTEQSTQILLAHRAGELTLEEKEIGSSAAFGSVNVMVSGQTDGLRHLAYGYLEAHLPGVPLHDMRMLLNHPVIEINPGVIILKEGDTPSDVMLLVSGHVEKLRTRDRLHGRLSVGSLIGGSAIIDSRPSRHTYRASSFLRVLRLPAHLFTTVVERNGLLERIRRAADLGAFLDNTNLFGDGLQVAVLGRIIDNATERRFAAGETIEGADLAVFNIIRSGRVERLLGSEVVDVLQERDFFGEEAAVFKGPCLFRIKVVEDTSIVQIPGEFLQDVPILRWKLFENCEQRAARIACGLDHSSGLLWRDELSIRVANMDLHHKRMLEIANVVAQNLYPDADRHALITALDALIDYTRYHFDAEEKLMALYNYADAADHSRGHEEMVGQLNNYAAQVLAEDAPDKTAFLRFFDTWLVQHIQHHDLAYGQFLNAKGVY